MYEKCKKQRYQKNETTCSINIYVYVHTIYFTLFLNSLLSGLSNIMLNSFTQELSMIHNHKWEESACKCAPAQFFLYSTWSWATLTSKHRAVALNRFFFIIHTVYSMYRKLQQMNSDKITYSQTASKKFNNSDILITVHTVQQSYSTIQFPHW